MDFLLFLLGACLASFCHVIGYRLPIQQSFLRGRSHCEKCREILQPLELIPLVSYIVLRGRCRYCNAQITPLAPVIELLAGCSFVVLYHMHSFTIVFFFGVWFTLLFVTISVSDIYYQLIPNHILLFFGIGIIFLSFAEPQLMLMRLVGSIGSFTFLLLFAWFSRGGIGGGDVKLYVLIGAVLGLPLAFISLFLSTLIGLVWFGLRRTPQKQAIPFAPSIALASMLTYFCGDIFLNWYYL